MDCRLQSAMQWEESILDKGAAAEARVEGSVTLMGTY